MAVAEAEAEAIHSQARQRMNDQDKEATAALDLLVPALQSWHTSKVSLRSLSREGWLGEDLCKGYGWCFA